MGGASAEGAKRNPRKDAPMDQSPIGAQDFHVEMANILRRSAAYVVWGTPSVGFACRYAAALHPRLKSYAPTALATPTA